MVHFALARYHERQIQVRIETETSSNSLLLFGQVHELPKLDSVPKDLEIIVRPESLLGKTVVLAGEQKTSAWNWHDADLRTGYHPACRA